MSEQRISSPLHPSTSYPTRLPQAQSNPSLRYPSSANRAGSRRLSTDLDNNSSSTSNSNTNAVGQSMSTPPSPITYFPPPSSFSHIPPGPNTANQYFLSNPPSTGRMSSSPSSDGRDGGKTPTNRSERTGFLTSESSPQIGSGSSQMGRAQSHASHHASHTHTRKDKRRGPPAPLVSRTASTPINHGYGSTSTNPPTNHGLGLGRPDALSSPRRITSTSSAMRSISPRDGAGGGALTGHGAYYNSQPATATRQFFDDQRRFSEAPTPTASRYSLSRRLSNSNPGFVDSINQTPRGHHRGRSSASAQRIPPYNDPGSTPSSSIFKRLQRTASIVGLGMGRSGEYDNDSHTIGGVSVGDSEREAEDEADDEGRRINGMRVWYSSYVTIDWIHDAIKDSSRVRKLRHNARKSYKGAFVNAYDRFQGWLIVTLVGILTALIAFLIIRSEMALFDLKEGFCSSSWGTAKRFCCAPKHPRSNPGSEAGAGFGFGYGLTDEEVCGDWVEWGQYLDWSGGDEEQWVFGRAEFVVYAVVALALATLSSTLTIHLSSSAHHSTSKDSKLLTSPVPSPTPTPTNTFPRSKPPPQKGNSILSDRQPLVPRGSDRADDLGKAIRGVEPARKVMYFAAGSGIPEIKTILSGFVIHGYLGGWTLLTKSVGLALSVASGLSLGKEGPFVHIASCVGNIVSRGFIKYETNEAKRREILSAACAAGVAVSFGAPIGGVLFSLEEVSYFFPPKVMWRSFWCAAVAAIVLKGTNPFGNGSIVLFAVNYTKNYHYWEFAIFVLLGVFGGLYGAIFSRLNILWSRHVRGGTWIRSHPIIEVFLVTLLTTVVSFMNPYTRMGGTELVANLFVECKSSTSNSLCVEQPDQIAQVIYMIAMALLIKGCLTIITFGIKLPAGIFIPSLAVGACFGRIVGLCMEWVEYRYPSMMIFDVCRETDCVLPGLYAMVGAAATLAGVTRTTVSLAVIMFELTGTLSYVVPVMIGVLVAKTVADGLEKSGIYELVINLNQLPYLNSKHEYLWGGRRISEVAQTDVPHLRADKGHTVRELTGKLLELVRLGLADTGFPVLQKEMILESDGRQHTCLRVVGFLAVNELEHALSTLSDEPDAPLNLMPDETYSQSRPTFSSRNSTFSMLSFPDSFADPRDNPYDLTRYMDRAPITVQNHSSLEIVQQLFVKLGARQIFVTDSRGIFKGVLYKKAWLSFLKELEEEHS